MVVDREDGTVEVFLDRTPFYAEGGGQIGDTGLIAIEHRTVEVLDTTAPVAGLHRHIGRLVDGEIEVGQTMTASIDVPRRASHHAQPHGDAPAALGAAQGARGHTSSSRGRGSVRRSCASTSATTDR